MKPTLSKNYNDFDLKVLLINHTLNLLTCLEKKEMTSSATTTY